MYVVLAMNKILYLLKPLNQYFETEVSDLVTALSLIDSTIMSLVQLKSPVISAELMKKANELLGETLFEIDNTDLESAVLYIPKRKRRRPAIFRRTDEVIYGDGTIFLLDDNEAKPLPQRLLSMFINTIDICESELHARFTIRNLSFMSSSCALLKRNTRTIDRLILLRDLKFEQIDKSAFQAELSVLDKFMDNDFNSLNELAKFFKPHRKIFPIFSTILDIALSLPVSTAKVESCFSALTRILIPQRLYMTHERKSNLVLLAYNKDITKSLDLDDFLKRFSTNSRKLRLY